MVGMVEPMCESEECSRLWEVTVFQTVWLCLHTVQCAAEVRAKFLVQDVQESVSKVVSTRDDNVSIVVNDGCTTGASLLHSCRKNGPRHILLHDHCWFGRCG